MTPQNYSILNTSQPAATSPSPFKTPYQSGAGSVANSLFSSLTANTPTFNPATVNQWNPTQNTGGIDFNAINLTGGQTPSTPSAPTIRTTPTGGTVFPASTFTGSPSVSPATSGTPVSYNSYQTPNGGSLSLDASGNVAGFTPAAGYNINTSGALPSSALGASLTPNDIMNKRNQYADAVAGLAQASQYSPDYLNAYKTSQNISSQEAALRGNLASGAAPGDTQGYAEGFTNRALQGADAQKAQADISLAVQTLVRNGNMAAAKALVDAYAPQSVSPGSSLVSPVNGDVTYGGSGAYSDYQAQQTYFNLAQNFPDAQIPAYNPQMSAQQNLQIAQQAAAGSPSFQSRNLVPVQLPGGGYSFVNKNQLITGANGQSQIISSADAAQADAYKTAIGTLTNQGAQISSQINTVDNNFPLLLNIVSKYNLNQNLPLMNQFQQLGDRQLGQSGIVQLNAVAQGLKATIAQIISRGGSVDNQTRNEANALLPTTVNLATLNDLYRVVKAEGAGVIKGINDEKQQNINGLTNIYSSGGSSGASSSGGYINPAQATW